MKMKKLLTLTTGCAVLAATFAVPVQIRAAENPPGYVDFGKFPETTGNQFVEVQINSNLIAMITKLAKSHEPEVADALNGLKRVRVNVIGLTDENRAEIEKKVKDIRKQLGAGGWEQIVTAQNKDDDVAVYVKTRGSDAIEGLVVTVLQAKREAVLVNIVGDIKPEKLSLVGERFNIEPLKKLGPNMARK